MRNYTINDVREFLITHDTNQDCTLLSDSYVNSRTPLQFLCNCCGKEFQRTFSQVKRNAKYSCARCSQGRFLTLEQIQEYLNEHDIYHECELLSTSYQNYSTPLKFKCNLCGAEFTRTFAQIKQNGGVKFRCTHCMKKTQARYNRLTISDVQNFIDEYDINHDCELISEDYIDNTTPLLFRCNCCGREYERTYATMQAKKAFKCFRCAHHLPAEEQSGVYNAVKNYFRSRLNAWKKEQLEQHLYCELTGATTELEIHHLLSFSTILKLASQNTGIPLNIKPTELKDNGYSLETLEKEFFKLHNELGQAVVLTRDVHQLFHKKYGYKNNTPEQYAQFKEEYLKGELNKGNAKQIKEH